MIELVKPWKWETEYGTARVVSTKKHVQKARDLIESRQTGGLLVDTETTGLERDRQLRLIQIGWGKTCWIIDPQSSLTTALVKPLMQAKWICHNAPFDLISFGNWHFGILSAYGKQGVGMYSWMLDKALAGEVVDTMITEQIITSNRFYQSLAKLAAEEGVPNLYADAWNNDAEKLGYTSENKYRAVSPNNKHWLRYSAHDIFQLRAVYRRVKADVEEQLVRDETLCHVMYRILCHRGMDFHFGMADELYRELNRARIMARAKLQPLGIKSENSHAQVRAMLRRLGVELTDKTKGGQLSVAKPILEGITQPKSAKRVIKQVLKARSLTTDMGSINNLATNSDGTRVYPDLRVIGAKTGRSSCSTPNLQQLNKHEGDARVRGLLMADWHHRLGSVDYDGIELRVIAVLTKDKRLHQRMMEGADIHGEVALEIYGKGYTPRERNKAKTGVFTLSYGGMPSTIAKRAGCSIEEAESLKLAWRELYPKVAKVSDSWIEEAELTGVTTLPNGWQPAVGLDKYGRIAGYRAVNYQVQGLAAFIFRQGAIQLAAANLWDYVRMTVHDEFACSIPEKQAEETLELIRETAEIKRGKMIYTTKGELYGRHWGLPAAA